MDYRIIRAIDVSPTSGEWGQSWLSLNAPFMDSGWRAVPPPIIPMAVGCWAALWSWAGGDQ